MEKYESTLTWDEKKNPHNHTVTNDDCVEIQIEWKCLFVDVMFNLQLYEYWIVFVKWQPTAGVCNKKGIDEEEIKRRREMERNTLE